MICVCFFVIIIIKMPERKHLSPYDVFSKYNHQIFLCLLFLILFYAVTSRPRTGSQLTTQTSSESRIRHQSDTSNRKTVLRGLNVTCFRKHPAKYSPLWFFACYFVVLNYLMGCDDFFKIHFYPIVLSTLVQFLVGG